ncbi:GIY-YIG nuclease family protein [Agriterribacter sp.]|uniref:GIY-YIG nuclease family protein n=1 Tax=Agriterribacter sp. TaxID=2821509 RepID=UPI002B9D2F74|nr:GIY-YIG nuclease family protein [Agriterribacter sp.]HRO44561.1 GIY-YIG nuclease family protein [Agriterribacter sp.]
MLYAGVTSNLAARIKEHKEKKHPKSFSARYNADKLVYYFFFPTIMEAIEEEKRIKGGSRENKIKIIESMNPGWKDLWEDIKEW